MALMNRPTFDPRLTRWWWRTLREWVYILIDPLWAAFRGDNADDVALANVTSINGVSSSELATLDGIAATTAELNKLAGLTADASELNKADRSAADGVAEASRNVVLDADRDVLGKRYDISQSLLDAVAAYLRLDGIDDYVSVSDDADIDFGTGDGTVEMLVYMHDVSADVCFYSRRQDGSNTIYLKYEQSAGNLLADAFTGGTLMQRARCGWSPAPRTWYHIVWVFENGSSNALYINAVSQTLNLDTTTGGDISIATDLYFGRHVSAYYQINIARLRQFNRALSADEVKALASGAPLDWGDVGAGMADLVTNGDVWTGASGSTPPNDWSDSGSGTATYIIRDNTPIANFGDDKALELNASSGSKTLYQGVAQAGKRYRVSFVYRNLDGSSSSYVALGSASNNVTLQNTGITGDGIKFEQEFLAEGTALMFFVDSGGTLQIDHVHVVQVGCVAEYLPGGITPAQWQDLSGNDLHGSVSGALPVNLPSNHVARYLKPGITGDITLTDVIPAGYRIKSMVAEVSGAGAGMRLNIGTSAGGTDVVNNQDISSNGLFDLTVAKNIFSLSSPQSLYVNDDGGTVWSGVSVDLYIDLERVK